MSKEGNFELSDQPLKEKIAYQDYMMQRTEIDPTIADIEKKSLLAGRDSDKFKHVEKEIKDSSKKSKSRTADYKTEM